MRSRPVRFLDEMILKMAQEEEAGPASTRRKNKPTKTWFEKVVHHPAFQAAGYGALTGEGIHALMERGVPRRYPSISKPLQRWAHGPVGRGFGTAAIAGSAAFLGGEAGAAAIDLFRKWRRKKS